MKLLPLFLIATAALAQTKVAQHMMLFEPTGTELNVSETLIVQGAGKGKVQIAVPADAGTPRVRNGEIAKTARPGIFDVTFDNPPEGRVDLAWSMPFVLPETLSGRILHSDGMVRMVFPRGVKVSGPALESNGVEPSTQASIYTLKGTAYKIDIDGAGSLRSQAPAAPESKNPDEDQPIDMILPRVYGKMYWILGLVFGILTVGFILNFKASVKR